MNKKITSILLVFFIAVSMVLSFMLRKERTPKNLHQSAKQSEINKCDDLLYEVGVLKRAMVETINTATNNNELDLKLTATELGPSIILHLKSNACTQCNNNTIIEIIKKITKNKNFFIVSHPTNKFFFEKIESLSFEGLQNDIIWHSPKLFNPELSHYDAELLFIDQQNRVTGIIPLEYLKIEGLLDGVVN